MRKIIRYFINGVLILVACALIPLLVQGLGPEVLSYVLAPKPYPGSVLIKRGDVLGNGDFRHQNNIYQIDASWGDIRDFYISQGYTDVKNTNGTFVSKCATIKFLRYGDMCWGIRLAPYYDSTENETFYELSREFNSY